MERCIVVGERLALVAALLAVVAGHATPHTMPTRLTGAAHGGYDTAYGNGHFGHWTTDRFGLPAFVYTADEARDPAARWSDNAGATHTTFWHQVGNDRIVADAYTQLWDQERQYRFSNQYDASTRPRAITPAATATSTTGGRHGARCTRTARPGRPIGASSAWATSRRRSAPTASSRATRSSRRSATIPPCSRR